MVIHNLLTFEEGIPKAKQAIEKGIAIDPSYGEAYMQLAWNNLWYDWDWENMLLNYEKAMDLGLTNPNYIYAWFQALLYGNTNEALRRMTQLVENDPQNMDYLRSLIWCYLFDRQFQKAIEVADLALEIAPQNSELHRVKGYGNLLSGRNQEALENFNRAVDYSDGKGWYQAGVIITLSSLGQKQEAKKLLLELSEDSSIIKIPALGMAVAYMYLDDKDKAFFWLDKAYENRDFWMVSLQADPGWDKIRNDPRFHELLEKMNFPD